VKDVKLKITQCPESGVVYIRITDNKVAKTVSIGKLNYADLDSEGRIVGIEIIDFPGKLVTV